MNFATERDIRTAASEAFATSQASTCESWSSERRFARIFDSSKLLSIRQGSNEGDSDDSKQPEPARVADRHEAQANGYSQSEDSPRPQANRW